MTTYNCLKYHIVFGTRYRRSLLLPQIRPDLYSYIGGILRSEGGHLDSIGGVEDHVHILAGIPPRVAVSDMLRTIKAGSSKWMNENKHSSKGFEWQRGFGAFTVSKSNMSDESRYIENQDEHHRKSTFADEFRALLVRHEIVFEERYLFDDERT